MAREHFFDYGGLVLTGTHLPCTQKLAVRFRYPPPIVAGLCVIRLEARTLPSQGNDRSSNLL